MNPKPGQAVRGAAQNGRVFNRDGWRCVYCGYDGGHATRYVFLEMDHLDPVTKLDDDFDQEYDENKVTACHSCNRLKGDYRPVGETKEEKLRDANACLESRRRKLVDWFQMNFVAP